MERLTERNKSGRAMAACCGKACEYNYCCEVGGFSDCKGIDDIIDRLADIEDILGDEYDLDRLREVVEADKAGRCFVSEIELGGEVFFIPKFNGVPYCGVKKGHVQALSFTRAGKRVKIREHHAHNQDFMLGKTVFTTRAAAEAALNKMKEAQA